MYFKNKLREIYNDEEINLFVDMDGVITDYDFGSTLNFKDKRPIKTNIKTLSQLNKDSKINLYILSICKTDAQIQDKNNWLDKQAPFFNIANRYIISKEKYPDLSSKEIKLRIIRDIIESSKLSNVVLIDDDNGILKYIKESNLNIILFQDSSLID
ncbi:MAG: hypothetical protein OSJ70_03440 [Bacilli bacterium]|nr:hypothetical protein [Bacilli bacterium]